MLDLLRNPYFLIPVISFFVAQLAKFTIRVWRGSDQGVVKKFFASGNMPSSHTALVVALALTAAFEGGLDSPEFGISFAFAAIVIYDAVNVRRAVGEHGGVLIMLIERMRVPKEERETLKLEEVLGHQPIEVIVGGILGFVIALVLEAEKWFQNFMDDLGDISSFELNAFYGISAGAVVLGFLAVAVFRRKHLRKLPTTKAILRVIARGLIMPGLLGLLFTWLLQERVARFDTAIWLFGTLIWSIAILTIASFTTFRGAIGNLSTEKEHFSEEKKRLRASRRKKSKKRR